MTVSMVSNGLSVPDNLSGQRRIERHILSHLKTHMIIVLHDGRDTHVGYPRDNLIAALPTIIEDLKARGYTFVAVDKFTK